MNEQELLSAIKEDYLENLMSIKDLTIKYNLHNYNIKFLITFQGIKLRNKNEGAHTLKARNMRLYEAIKPTKSVLQSQLDEIGKVSIVISNYYPQVPVRVLHSWIEEYQIRFKKKPRIVAPQDRLKNILAKINQNGQGKIQGTSTTFPRAVRARGI